MKNLIYKKLRSYARIFFKVYSIYKAKIKSNFIKYILFKVKRQSNLKRFKNLYLNESCYIIGNGPSLNIEDLKMIHNKFIFASNKIFKIQKEFYLKPNFYFVQDTKLLKDEQILNLIRTGYADVEIFLPFNRLDCKYRKILKDVNYFYLKYKRGVQLKHREFSLDIDKHICVGGTVTYSMIQAAVYFGFKKIYLLGIDNTKPIKGGDSHFYENQNVDVKESIVTPSYLRASHVIARTDVKIYNCTRGGKLEVFPRKKLEDTLK